MQDEAILDLYFARNERALVETEKQYGAYCKSVIGRIVNPEDTDECFNDMLLAAWQSIPPNRPERFRLYLARIARNLAFNRYKGKKAQKRGSGEIDTALDELAEVLQGKESVEDSLIAKELSASLQRFVADLPERERFLFVQRYFFVCPVNEIAEEIGVSSNHAAVILRRTREKLRISLSEEGYEI